MQKIAKKFVEVMKDCSHVAKNGTNSFHQYKYATATDVLEKVNTSLTKHGIASIVTPNLLSMQQVTTAKGNVEQLATVEVSVMLIDADSGESLTLKGLAPDKILAINRLPRRKLWLSNTAILTVLPLPPTTTPKPIATLMKSCILKPFRKKITLRTVLLATSAIVSFLKRLPTILKTSMADFSASTVNVQKNPPRKRNSPWA